jgi:hypothetical protein
MLLDGGGDFHCGVIEFRLNRDVIAPYATSEDGFYNAIATVS